VDNNVSLA